MPANETHSGLILSQGSFASFTHRVLRLIVQTILTSDFSLCLPPQQDLVLPGGLMQLLKYAYMAATALPYFINSLWIHTNIKHYSNIIHREWCIAGIQGWRPTRLVPLRPRRLKNLHSCTVTVYAVYIFSLYIDDFRIGNSYTEPAKQLVKNCHLRMSLAIIFCSLCKCGLSPAPLYPHRCESIFGQDSNVLLWMASLVTERIDLKLGYLWYPEDQFWLWWCPGLSL